MLDRESLLASESPRLLLRSMLNGEDDGMGLIELSINSFLGSVDVGML